MLTAVAALFAQAIAPGGPRDALEVGLIHVEANVDSAAGGHVGLRVGNLVYHFQQAGGGLLRLKRTEWVAFRHVYAGLQNRSLYVTILDVSRDDAERIALHAAGVWIEQERAHARVRDLADDAGWWAALRDGTAPPSLAAAGLLSAAEKAAAPGRELLDALREAHDADFAERRLSWLDRTIAATAWTGPTLAPLRERCTEREVVRAIGRAAPLDPTVLFDAGENGPLTSAERQSLGRFKVQLRRSVIRLWNSPRPDRGRALAIAVARHHAVARSLAENRLLLIDVFPDHAAIVHPSEDDALLAYAPLRDRSRGLLRDTRASILVETTTTEWNYGRLEELATRAREAARGARGESVRVALGRLLPSRGRVIELPGVPARTGSAQLVGAAATRVDRAWRQADAALRARYDYSLLGRNCATELVVLLNGAFRDEADVTRALGRCLVPGEYFGFIPWVLAGQVREGLRLRELRIVWSHRRRVAAQRSRESVWSAVREGTALTSTVYRPRSVDGWFLLFTDEVVWNRPLCGAVNLGYGLLRGVAGLFVLPFDGGEEAWAGLHGAFYSLPELVFCNIRKGTFPFVDSQAGRSVREFDLGEVHADAALGGRLEGHPEVLVVVDQTDACRSRDR